MPEITVSVEQDAENYLVESVVRLVDHDDVIVLVANMRTKHPSLKMEGGAYEEGHCIAKVFYFGDDEHRATMAVRGVFGGLWRSFCVMDRYSAFICLVKIGLKLGENPEVEVWRRDGQD